nr:MAG TPA: hypothetical protein [Caudoviricetes sp.]
MYIAIIIYNYNIYQIFKYNNLYYNITLNQLI